MKCWAESTGRYVMQTVRFGAAKQSASFLSEELAQGVGWIYAAGFRPGDELGYIHPPIRWLAVEDQTGTKGHVECEPGQPDEAREVRNIKAPTEIVFTS